MAKRAPAKPAASRITRSKSTKTVLERDIDSVKKKRRPTFNKICKQLSALTMKPSVAGIRQRRKSILLDKVPIGKTVNDQSVTENMVVDAPCILQRAPGETQSFVAINPSLLQDETVWNDKSLGELCSRLSLTTRSETKTRYQMLNLLENFNVAPLDGGQALCSTFTTIPTSGKIPVGATPTHRGSILRKKACTNRVQRSNSICFSPYNEVKYYKREMCYEREEVENQRSVLENIYTFLSKIGRFGIA